MKLAEALMVRSDLQKRLHSLQSRLNKNVLVQEGDEPNENPAQLLAEIFATQESLHELIIKIHKTNASVVFDDGRDLLSVLSQRDTLMAKHKTISTMLEHTSKEPDRYSYREIKWQTTIDVEGYQRQADDIALELRQLNIDIQAKNWAVELLEQ